jgi:hypothetical protein
MNLNSPNFVKSLFLQLILVCVIGFSFTISTFADQSDWGMVDRFNKLMLLAQKGNIKAMYEVGKRYERGRGVKKSYTEAANWYQKAASGGQSAAQGRLGILYFEGRGVTQNYKIALDLLTSAANDNVPSAQFQLANMYELGAGVAENLELAVSWYKKAYKNGYYLAQSKVETLSKRLEPAATNPHATATNQAKAKVRIRLSPLVQTITSARWFKAKEPVPYLPSNISNCVQTTQDSISCISTPQERSTGTELITYNTESTIHIVDNNSFNIAYTNNVLDVTLLSVEDGNGEVIAATTSRIKKGKRGRKKTMECNLKNKKLISCNKNGSTFELVNR